jgi:hypothetical protein
MTPVQQEKEESPPKKAVKVKEEILPVQKSKGLGTEKKTQRNLAKSKTAKIQAP